VKLVIEFASHHAVGVGVFGQLGPGAVAGVFRGQLLEGLQDGQLGRGDALEAPRHLVDQQRGRPPAATAAAGPVAFLLRQYFHEVRVADQAGQTGLDTRRVLLPLVLGTVAVAVGSHVLLTLPSRRVTVFGGRRRNR
jgi:hypothetical protein